MRGGLVGRHSLVFGFVRVASSDERLDSYGLRMFLAANLLKTSLRELRDFK
jgi:hypothetical protein